MEAVRTCFARYIEFDGEASRPEFWWFFVFVVVGNSILATFSRTLGGLFAIIVFVPYLAVTVRRLRDENYSPAWLLIWFVPLIGWIILAYLLVQDSDRLSRT